MTHPLHSQCIGAAFGGAATELAGTGNKVAGIDLWDGGKPSPVMTALDLPAIVPLVWGDSGTYGVGTKGKIQSDSNLTNVLAKDELS